MPKRPVAAGGSEPGLPAAKRSTLLAKFERLLDHLLNTRYDDGPDQRLPGTLSIRPSGGAWHLTLREPSAGLQLRVAGETFELALGAIEALLAQPATPWEVDPYAKPTKRKK